jgi:hypothetical protein
MDNYLMQKVMNDDRILLVKIGGKKARKSLKEMRLMQDDITNIQFAGKTQKIIFINLRMSKLYINLFRVLALLLAGLALIRPMMDLTALPWVIHLPKDDYAAVQYGNRSWAWLELIRLASFFSVVVLFFVEREHNRVMWPIRGAFIAQWVMIILYVAFTLPINVTTFNWTFLPDSNWSWLRTEWEYSRGLSAIVGGISFVLVVLDLVWAKWR